MSAVNIPGKALEAASTALGLLVWSDYNHKTDMDRDEHEGNAVAALTAAAPFLAAQALEEAAQAIDEDQYDDLDPFYANWLRHRATRIREFAEVSSDD